MSFSPASGEEEPTPDWAAGMKIEDIQAIRDMQGKSVAALVEEFAQLCKQAEALDSLEAREVLRLKYLVGNEKGKKSTELNINN